MSDVGTASRLASTADLIAALESRIGRSLPAAERKSIETKMGQKIEAGLRRVSGGTTGHGKPDIVVDGVGAFEVCLSANSKNSKGQRGDRQLLADHPRAWIVQCFGRVRSQHNGGIPTISAVDFLEKCGIASDVWDAILVSVVDELSAMQQPLFEVEGNYVPPVSHYSGGLILRYPGSKKWLAPIVASTASELGYSRVVEPFIGAGGMAIALMRSGLLVSGSDANRALCCLWNCIRERPAELADAIARFTPTLESFYTMRGMLREESISDEVQAALAKLVVHQMGYGTLGEMSGGPIGGRQQEGKKYKLDARWNVQSLIRRIYSFHELFAGKLDGRVDNVGFEKVADDRPSLLYLDPPYFVPGAALYHAQTDHRLLRQYLGEQSRPWILSYDDVPDVRQLYDGFLFVEVLTLPKVTSPASGRPPQRELVLTNNERVHAALEDWAADR